MSFNQHSNLEGCHAILSPSKFYWLNYTDEKIINYYMNYLAAQRGVELHEFAKQCVNLNQRLPKSRKTLNMYVNDAIGFKMSPEQPLYYSDICFGTADAISFRNHTLRVHDLKTGSTPAHMEQLEIYAALFCLEYRKKPSEINVELRLYQNNEVEVYNPTPADISETIDKIVHKNKLIMDVREQEGIT